MSALMCSLALESDIDLESAPLALTYHGGTARGPTYRWLTCRAALESSIERERGDDGAASERQKQVQVKRIIVRRVAAAGDVVRG